jgi:cytidyltransferase-like protein
MASYKTVLAAGCFDPFHVGHVWHLKAARAMGKILVVAVTKDRSVGKGPGRPVFTELERAEMVEPYCDSWILVDDSLEALQKVDPDVFVKGADYRGKIEKPHLEYCRARGIAIAFTKTKKYSSTELLHHYAKRVDPIRT